MIDVIVLNQECGASKTSNKKHDRNLKRSEFSSEQNAHDVRNGDLAFELDPIAFAVAPLRFLRLKHFQLIKHF